jgi:queuine tRNA-ribosyltransferase
MHGVLAMTAPMLPAEVPKHLLGIGEPDDLLEGIGLGIDLFDCAVPTRLARHGIALANLPETRFRFDLTRPAHAADESPLVEGCPCSVCARHTRAYLHYLCRAESVSAGRLLTLHNLTFLERLAAGAREAITASRFGAYRAAVMDATTPWDAAAELPPR